MMNPYPSGLPTHPCHGRFTVRHVNEHSMNSSSTNRFEMSLPKLLSGTSFAQLSSIYREVKVHWIRICIINAAGTLADSVGEIAACLLDVSLAPVKFSKPWQVAQVAGSRIAKIGTPINLTWRPSGEERIAWEPLATVDNCAILFMSCMNQPVSTTTTVPLVKCEIIVDVNFSTRGESNGFGAGESDSEVELSFVKMNVEN